MTQVEMIKKHFEAQKSLTVVTALNLYGIYALSQRVGELKRQGYPIESHMETKNGKSYMRYRKGKRDLLSRVRAM